MQSPSIPVGQGSSEKKKKNVSKIVVRIDDKDVKQKPTPNSSTNGNSKPKVSPISAAVTSKVSPSAQKQQARSKATPKSIEREIPVTESMVSGHRTPSPKLPTPARVTSSARKPRAARNVENSLTKPTAASQSRAKAVAREYHGATASPVASPP